MDKTLVRKLLLLLGLLLFCAMPSNAQTFFQHADCAGSSTAACNGWSVGNLTAGSTLIAILNCGNSTCSGSSVPTSAGGCYKPLDFNTTATVDSNNQLSYVIRFSGNSAAGPMVNAFSITQTSNGIPSAPTKLGILLMAGK
jgi:hypothetical protein